MRAAIVVIATGAVAILFCELAGGCRAALPLEPPFTETVAPSMRDR